MKAVIIICALALTIQSCQSHKYYWSEQSTPHGERAQQRYIKRARGHRPERRFHSHQSTFGAVDRSKSKNK